MSASSPARSRTLSAGLVPVAQFVDQAALQGLGGAVGRPVDQRAHLRGGHAPVLGDRGHDLLEPGVDQALQVAALGLGQGVVGEDVHHALVFLALGEPGRDADLVERAAQEGALQEQAGQVEVAGGL